MSEIDFSKSAQYDLSIRLSTEGFAYAVHDPQGDPPTVCFDYATNDDLSLTANLKQMFREVSQLALPYRRVRVLMAGKRVTYVPLELFEDEQMESLFHYAHMRQENEQVCCNILRKSNMVVLFGMDRSAVAFLGEQHPAVHFYAQSSPLIEHLTEKSRLGANRKMYVHLRGEETDVYVFERGMMELANVMPGRETADRMYYLLYLWKLLGLDQERDELHLIGASAPREALLPELKRYVRQVSIMSPATNLDLQTINLCE